MRAVVQRVRCASVAVEGKTVGEIGIGLLVLLGVGKGDTPDTARWMAEKVSKLRIFSDDEGRFNCSLAEVEGSLLVVSQFTLFGDVRKGTRPSFTTAADPSVAVPLYEQFCSDVRNLGHQVATGQFGAMMQVSLINDGPVTIILER